MWELNKEKSKAVSGCVFLELGDNFWNGICILCFSMSLLAVGSLGVRLCSSPLPLSAYFLSMIEAISLLNEIIYVSLYTCIHTCIMLLFYFQCTFSVLSKKGIPLCNKQFHQYFIHKPIFSVQFRDYSYSLTYLWIFIRDVHLIKKLKENCSVISVFYIFSFNSLGEDMGWMKSRSQGRTHFVILCDFIFYLR